MTSKEKISVSPFDVFLNDKGIVEAYWNRDVTEVTKEHMMSLRDQLKILGFGKKLPLFVHSIEFLPLSPDAREYIATEESSKYTLANAIQIDTLAKKLVFNFILRFSHPKAPTKAFSTREEAFEWLVSIKKKAESL